MKEAIALHEFINSTAGWTGPEIARSAQNWHWILTAEQVSELKKSAARFLSTGIPLTKLTVEDFPLYSLEERLKHLRDTLIHGIGFEVVSGVPVKEIGETAAAVIFFGIGAHLGRARPQNSAGELLGHVRDLGADSSDPNTRIYQTSERQTFHTDSADVVGLMCLNEAREGGDSLLVSGVTIYNEIRRTRPDLLPLLFEKIATDRRGEVPKGGKPFFEIPVFSWHEGFLTVMYQRQYIESAQRFPGAPKLTARHFEALDLFDSLADDNSLNLSMRLGVGDMQFVYNHSLLHDRTAFIDYAEPEKRRHLLRLWLAMPGDRPLPACFAERYGSVEIGNRGGVVLDAPVT